MIIKISKKSHLQNLEHSHTEIRQFDTVREESYRAQQFTVWVASIAARLTCRLRPTRWKR